MIKSLGFLRWFFDGFFFVFLPHWFFEKVGCFNRNCLNFLVIYTNSPKQIVFFRFYSVNKNTKVKLTFLFSSILLNFLYLFKKMSLIISPRHKKFFQFFLLILKKPKKTGFYWVFGFLKRTLVFPSLNKIHGLRSKIK